MKEERLLSSDYDRVADAATPNLVGAGAAFVLELFDLKTLPSFHRISIGMIVPSSSTSKLTLT